MGGTRRVNTRGRGAKEDWRIEEKRIDKEKKGGSRRAVRRKQK